MGQKPYEFRSEILRRFYEKAEALGRAQGEAQGMAHGRVDSLLVVLAAWGLSASAEQQARIRVCNDVATLNQWLQRAVLASSVHEVLQD